MRLDQPRKRLATALLMCLFALVLTGCGDQEGAYDKALAIFSQGDYARAATAFEKLGDFLQAETYAAYAQGLTYYEQDDYAAAEPYFAQTRDFMYGEQRYRYCHAYVLETADAFADAAQWYLDLGDFEDAVMRAAYCLARTAEINEDYETALVKYSEASGYRDAEARLDTLNFEIFDRATALMNALEYKQAFLLFTLLGDRYDAPGYARTCKNKMQEQDYLAAEQMIKDGDLQGAYDLFNALIGFRDAASRADELASLLGIDQTQQNQGGAPVKPRCWA